MKRRAPLKMLMAPFAVVFLCGSWFWQGCIGLARRIVALFPWEPLKVRIAAGIAKLPAPVALVLFLIPVAIVEPMQTVFVYLAARGHVLLGVIGYFGLKFFGLGLIAVTFDLTREKLLSMPWFVWIYDKFVAFHDFAHSLIEPYRQAALGELRTLRLRLRAWRVRLRAGARRPVRGG